MLISVTTLRSTLANSKERALGEHYNIAAALSKDLNVLSSRKANNDMAVEQLIWSYVSNYERLQVILTVYQDGRPVGSNSSFHSPQPEETRDGHRAVSMQKLEGKDVVQVWGNLPFPNQNYSLSYQYDISSTIMAWKHATHMLFGIGLILSTLLAISLLVILTKIFKPLQEITSTSKDIAAGQYNRRIPIQGGHELGEMADSFNHMAEEIQHKMDELSAAAQQKQRFIDNLAHELRTPLTAIYGYAEYLQVTDASPEDIHAATAYIMSESRRLQDLSRRLLSMATWRENPPLLNHPVEVQALFDRTIRTLKGQANDKQVSLQSQCYFDTIQGEPELLYSLLMNLVENGIKACRPGGTVHLRAYWDAQCPVIEVEDDGKGINPEQMEHITEAFYRADYARSRNEGGFGLGLALCQQIADLHQAQLLFLSSPDQGTKVKIVFILFAI